MPRRDTESHKSSVKSPPLASPAHSFWSGTISFGLVSVPVDFFPAARRGSSLRMLDQDGTPLARRYFCPKHHADVHPEHILRGYELESGEYVVIRDDELESIEPKKTREIDLREFVDLDAVSPALFLRGYYLAPSGETNKAYRLLAAAMEHSQKVGIASFVMRAQEHLVAIIAEQGILSAMTLRFHDELRTPEDVGLPKIKKPTAKDFTAFQRAIRKLRVEELDEKDLEARESVDLRSLAQKKLRRNEDVVKAPATPDEEVDDSVPYEDEDVALGPVDLLEAIRRSLKGGEKRPPSRRAMPGRKSKQTARGASLAELTKDELYRKAQTLDVDGRSEMSKHQLVQALAKRTRRR
jgi:DNA end-binding protein Ku